MPCRLQTGVTSLASNDGVADSVYSFACRSGSPAFDAGNVRNISRKDLPSMSSHSNAELMGLKAFQSGDGELGAPVCSLLRELRELKLLREALKAELTLLGHGEAAAKMGTLEDDNKIPNASNLTYTRQETSCKTGPTKNGLGDACSTKSTRSVATECSNPILVEPKSTRERPPCRMRRPASSRACRRAVTVASIEPPARQFCRGSGSYTALLEKTKKRPRVTEKITRRSHSSHRGLRRRIIPSRIPRPPSRSTTIPTRIAARKTKIPRPSMTTRPMADAECSISKLVVSD